MISQPFWATRHPAFLWHSRGVGACLVVRKWANVWLQRRETVDRNWFTVWVWQSKEMIVERSQVILCIYCLMKMHISVIGVIINIISVACLYKEKLWDPSNNWYCWNITSHLVIHLIGFHYAVVDVMFCPSRNRLTFSWVQSVKLLYVPGQEIPEPLKKTFVHLIPIVVYLPLNSSVLFLVFVWIIQMRYCVLIDEL